MNKIKMQNKPKKKITNCHKKAMSLKMKQKFKTTQQKNPNQRHITGN